MGALSRVIMLRIKRKIMRAGLYPSACAWVDQLEKLHGVERGRVGRSHPNPTDKTSNHYHLPASAIYTWVLFGCLP